MKIVNRKLVEQGLRQSRLLVQHVVPAFVKPARTLWNEIIGFLFLSFAVIFGIQAVRYYMAGDGVRLFFAGFCTCVMAWFGVSSFRRARKISRS
jgi:hypothetical protein